VVAAETSPILNESVSDIGYEFGTEVSIGRDLAPTTCIWIFRDSDVPGRRFETRDRSSLFPFMILESCHPIHPLHEFIQAQLVTMRRSRECVYVNFFISVPYVTSGSLRFSDADREQCTGCDEEGSS
jgi:hypothetical protein